MVTVRGAEGAGDIGEARRLMRAFVEWHRAWHREDLRLIERYFDAAAWEAELVGLPGKYGPPGGALLLGLLDGEAVGCVALRDLGGGSGEMKRMFVEPRVQGQGVGRALARAVIERGRELGYARMLLDTSVRQVEAIGLYRGLGFREVGAYYEVPEEVRGWLVFMEREL